MTTTRPKSRVWLPPEVHRQLKVVAAGEGKTMAQLVQEALLLWAQVRTGSYDVNHLDKR